jgi:hypothetical protein
MPPSARPGSPSTPPEVGSPATSLAGNPLLQSWGDARVRGPTGIIGLLFLQVLCFLNFNGNVRAAKFAQSTRVAIVQASDHSLFVLVEFKDLFRAEGNANPATLAQIPVDFQDNILFS